jgi:hypothetical protein
MKFYRRLNHYLLENQPLLWHSRVFNLLFAGIAFMALSFVVAYLLVDLKSLQETNIDEYYFESSFVLFHSIFVIVVLTFWAIYFYRNNAFKKFYPLPKAYFQKLFFLIFIGISPLLMAYFSFTYGVKSKAKSLISEAELKEDKEKLNLAAVFFPSNIENYELNNRVYPGPFPLTVLRAIDATSMQNYYMDSTLHGKKYIHEYEAKEVFSFYDTTKIVKIDEVDYFIFSTHEKYLLPDSCYSNTFIDSFYSEKSFSFPVERNSLYNFSAVLFSNNYDGNDYKKKYAPTIHTWLNERNKKAILQAMNDFVSIFRKYQVGHNLDVNSIYQFLEDHEMKNIINLVEQYSYYSHYDEVEYGKNYKENNYSPRFFMDSYAMERLFYNGENMNKHISLEVYISVGFFTLFLTCMFIWFEFAEPLQALISIPIAGLLMIFVGIAIAFAPYSFGSGLFNYGLWFVLFLFIFIQSLNLIAIYTQLIGRKFANIIFQLAFLCTPFILPIISGMIHSANTHEKQAKCYSYEQVSILDGLLISPLFMFTLSLLSVLIFLSLLKRWKAMPE